MNNLLCFIAVFIISSCFIYSDELTAQQQKNIEKLTSEIEKAEETDNVNTIQMRLRYGKKSLDSLLKEISDHEQVKQLLQRYQQQQQRISLLQAKKQLTNTMKSASYKIKKYTGKEVPSWEKKGLEKYLQQLEKSISALPKEDETTKQAQEMIAQLQKLLENDDTAKDNSTSTNQKNSTSTTTQAEKDAEQQLKKILNFAKRYVEQGEEVQKQLQAGEKIPTMRYSDITKKLVSYTKQAIPHAQVLAADPDKYKDLLAQYGNLFEIAKSLSQTQQQSQGAAQNQAITDSLKLFFAEMAKVEEALNGYSEKISGEQPISSAQTLLKNCQFSLDQSKKRLMEVVKRYGNQPQLINAGKQFVVLHKKFQELSPQIQEEAMLEHTKNFVREAKKILKENTSDTMQFNRQLEHATQNIHKALEYVQQNQGKQSLQKILPEIQRELQECAKFRIQEAHQASLRAINAKKFTWLETNLQAAKQCAGQDSELAKFADDYEEKVIRAACEACFQSQEEFELDKLGDWYHQCWKSVLQITNSKPHLEKIVAEIGNKILERHFQQAMAILDNKETTVLQRVSQFVLHKESMERVSSGNKDLEEILRTYREKYQGPEQEIQDLYHKERMKQLEQQRIMQEEYEKNLSPEQLEIFREWRKSFPVASKKGDMTIWIYTKSETFYDELHIYHFDTSGKLLNKEMKKQGGGVVKGFRDGTWTTVAQVHKDGNIEGYPEGGGGLTKLFTVSRDGSVYGYRDKGSWTRIGEVKDGEVSGYRDNSWDTLAKIQDNGVVFGYKPNGSWGKIAEIDEKGTVEGYRTDTSWSKIAELHVIDETYRIAAFVFVIHHKKKR